MGYGPAQGCGDSSGPWIVSIAGIEQELVELKQNSYNNEKNMKNFMGGFKSGQFPAGYFGGISRKFGWTVG